MGSVPQPVRFCLRIRMLETPGRVSLQVAPVGPRACYMLHWNIIQSGTYRIETGIHGRWRCHRRRLAETLSWYGWSLGMERIYQGGIPPKYTEFKINLGLRKLHIIQAPAIAWHKTVASENRSVVASHAFVWICHCMPHSAPNPRTLKQTNKKRVGQIACLRYTIHSHRVHTLLSQIPTQKHPPLCFTARGHIFHFSDFGMLI